MLMWQFFNCLRPITRMESPSNVWHLKWQTIYLEENKQNRQTGLHNFPLSLSCEICSGNICASFLSWIVIWNSVEGSELNCHNGIQSGWKGGVEPREGRVAKNKFCTGFNPSGFFGVKFSGLENVVAYKKWFFLQFSVSRYLIQSSTSYTELLCWKCPNKPHLSVVYTEWFCIPSSRTAQWRNVHKCRSSCQGQNVRCHYHMHWSEFCSNLIGGQQVC